MDLTSLRWRRRRKYWRNGVFDKGWILAISLG